MKYVKTKDGKIWSFSNPNNNFLYEGSDTKNGKWLHEIGEVVKEADTIEELCDMFVLLGKNGEFVAISDDLLFVEHFAIKIEEPIIYGAIWTDKGLIYVAKINEKGELELL